MLTDSLDLRTGDPPWDDRAWTIPAADPLPSTRCDVAVIGGGITGAIIAERLSSDGHSVVVLDRRPPGLGSTAASTAQLMWTMDVPLCDLAGSVGEAEAARRWRRVHAAVRRFGERLESLGVDDGRCACPTLYLEGSSLDAAQLKREAELHRKHGLPSRFLAAGATAERFGISPRAAIVSDDGLAIDPVRTAHSLLEVARTRGAIVCFPVDVTGVREGEGEVVLSLAGGRELAARRIVLATGYERAALFLPPAFTLMSTFVIATPPGSAPLWRERAMIWEAADPYLYVRADPDGRILAGGEDIDSADPARRDALIGQKAGIITAKLAAMVGEREIVVERAWAATFGSSPDGLPAIGPAANIEGLWLAAGFGGNGIAFSAMAAEMISGAFSGKSDSDADCFSPYRF